MFDARIYEKAARTLGSFDSKKELAWLVEFAAENLSALPEATRELRRYQLYVCTGRGGGLFVMQTRKTSSADACAVPSWQDLGEDAPLPSFDQMQRLQAWVHAVFRDLLAGREVNLETGPLQFEISTVALKTPGPRALVTVTSESPDTMFSLRLAHLLQQHGGHLSACNLCAKWFLKKRRDQHFCSHACMNRQGQRRFAARKKLEKAQRLRKKQRSGATRKSSKSRAAQ